MRAENASQEEFELVDQGGEARECESSLLIYAKHLKGLAAKRADLGWSTRNYIGDVLI